MFDMFVREYFDNSLIPLSDTIEAFVFRRDNIVQAGNRTATRISRVQFGIRMLLVIQNWYSGPITKPLFFLLS